MLEESQTKSEVSKDEFGDRMKGYERVETSRTFDKSLPLYCRLDGRSFSSFTRGMERPFDKRFSFIMMKTAESLVRETRACAAFVQSDEISLLWRYPVDFGGKIQKLASTLASTCTSEFMFFAHKQLEERHFNKRPTFDCRVVNLPDQSEGANMMLWRHLDCRKNAVSMVASHEFPVKQLIGVKHSERVQKLLEEKNINFDEAYPDYFRHGIFIVPRLVERDINDHENQDIPEAVRQAGGKFYRAELRHFSLPFVDVANRVEFLFDNAEPAMKTESNNEDTQG